MIPGRRWRMRLIPLRSVVIWAQSPGDSIDLAGGDSDNDYEMREGLTEICEGD